MHGPFSLHIIVSRLGLEISMTLPFCGTACKITVPLKKLNFYKSLCCYCHELVCGLKEKNITFICLVKSCKEIFFFLYKTMQRNAVLLVCFLFINVVSCYLQWWCTVCGGLVLGKSEIFVAPPSIPHPSDPPKLTSCCH